MRKIRKSNNPATEDLDLAPMLAMIVSLIPILLLSFSFYQSTTLNISTQTKGKNQKTKAKPITTLTIHSNGTYKLEVTLKKKRLFTKSFGDKVNSQKNNLILENHIQRLFTNYPKIYQIRIAPRERVSYESIIRTVDTIKSSAKEHKRQHEIVFSNLFKG